MRSVGGAIFLYRGLDLDEMRLEGCRLCRMKGRKKVEMRNYELCRAGRAESKNRRHILLGILVLVVSA